MVLKVFCGHGTQNVLRRWSRFGFATMVEIGFGTIVEIGVATMVAILVAHQNMLENLSFLLKFKNQTTKRDHGRDGLLLLHKLVEKCMR